MSAPRAASRPSVVIRPATLDDLDAVVRLRIALLREHHGNQLYSRLRPDAAERARPLFAAQLQSPHEVVLLADAPDAAEAPGEPVGILRCVESAGSPLLLPARYAYVSSVYVVPAARRRGILRRLLAEATAWAHRRGLPEMRLHNAPENPLSTAAWEALGFEVVEHLRMRPILGAPRSRAADD